jgi:hypothetical protein
MDPGIAWQAVRIREKALLFVPAALAAFAVLQQIISGG